MHSFLILFTGKRRGGQHLAVPLLGLFHLLYFNLSLETWVEVEGEVAVLRIETIVHDSITATDE